MDGYIAQVAFSLLCTQLALLVPNGSLLGNGGLELGFTFLLLLLAFLFHMLQTEKVPHSGLHATYKLVLVSGGCRSVLPA